MGTEFNLHEIGVFRGNEVFQEFLTVMSSQFVDSDDPIC